MLQTELLEILMVILSLIILTHQQIERVNFGSNLKTVRSNTELLKFVYPKLIRSG